MGYGLDINVRDMAGLSPIHEYVRHEARPRDLILALIGHGAAVNASDNAGKTPLHSACSKLNEELAQLFLDNGARMNQQDNHGDTPLHITCLCYQKTYHISLVELL